MNNIAKIRQDLGITQKQLAVKIGGSQSRIANYERGFRKLSLSNARKVVSALNAFGANVDIDDVFPSET